jgi:hypothetical protein
MISPGDLERALRTVLGELKPYLPDLVLIGGWVPYLYRHRGPFGEWAGRDTLTRELDILVDRSMPGEGRPPLAVLLQEARFRPEGPAVWVRDAEAGEKIEFLAAHRGIARGKGHPVQVEEQPGISAISLPRLEILRDYTRTLRLPETPDGRPGLDVRVPTLGAYVANKAATFMERGRRQDEDGNLKIAKDLLYLRDLMAAGAEVSARIEAELEEIAEDSSRNAELVRTAANHLGLVVTADSQGLVRTAGRMVAERDPSVRFDETVARTRGYLADLHEILSGIAEKHT